MLEFNYKLYLVTDELSCLGRDFFWVVEEALKGGVDIVQLREKELDLPAFIQKAERLKLLCDTYKVPLIINDSKIVAQHVGAFGLHVGQSDESMASLIENSGVKLPVGLSLEAISDLEKPYAEQAWYYGVSPIFSTPTKPDTQKEWGLEGLANLRKKTTKKLVAIGNIKQENAASIIAAGADCLAVVSGICSADSPALAAEQFCKEIEKGFNHK